jgi:hypothetical protein
MLVWQFEIDNTIDPWCYDADEWACSGNAQIDQLNTFFDKLDIYTE